MVIEKGGVSRRKKLHPLGWPRNLTGLENEHFVVVHFSKTTRKKNGSTERWWMCRCKRCGNEKEIRQDYVLSKHAKSCGCLRRRSGVDHPCWKGVGNLYLDHFSGIKASAEKRDLDFNVTHEFLWALFQKQEGKCALTGLPISLQKSGRSRGTASVDRKDNAIGYTEQNVRWVHKDVNLMKRTLSDETLLFFAEKIVETLQAAGTVPCAPA